MISDIHTKKFRIGIGLSIELEGRGVESGSRRLDKEIIKTLIAVIDISLFDVEFVSRFFTNRTDRIDRKRTIDMQCLVLDKTIGIDIDSRSRDLFSGVIQCH